MTRAGLPKALLEITSDEREQLVRWTRRSRSAQALALRSRIVLGCAEGLTNKEVAARERVTQQTVGKWRQRFVDLRLDGLSDDPRPGRPASITADEVERVVVDTPESTPQNATHWSHRKMAAKAGVSASTVGRIWKAFELKPHRVDGFKLSSDPLFVDKVYDIVGLYLQRPESAVVLCVDEKSQVQTLARSQPALAMMPGLPEKCTHDYVRHGTTSLFAAFDTSDCTVISSLYRRHRAVEFRKFLIKIDQQVPDHLDVHLGCDNYGTHKSPAIKTWLAHHPRFHIHFTPTYSSWINQVERHQVQRQHHGQRDQRPGPLRYGTYFVLFGTRWFAYLTQDLLQRGDHHSVQALEHEIRGWVTAWNENPQPSIWTKTAEDILKSLGRLLQRNNGAGH